MSAITQNEAHAYLERWKLVEEAELTNLRTLTIETKFQQLNVLMASRSLFGDNLNREGESRAIGERWARIRRAARA